MWVTSVQFCFNGIRLLKVFFIILTDLLIAGNKMQLKVFRNAKEMAWEKWWLLNQVSSFSQKKNLEEVFHCLQPGAALYNICMHDFGLFKKFVVSI